VVRIDVDRSFVIADIPGLIEGAAQGLGLGLQFLKHLQRTRLLLHLVELVPVVGDMAWAESTQANDEPDQQESNDDQAATREICQQTRQLERELESFDASLLDKPRWLVFTKADLLTPEEARSRSEAVVAALGWQQPWMTISSVTSSGTQSLVQSVMATLVEMDEEAAEAERESLVVAESVVDQ
jgi:GTP-binding protein